MTGAGGEINEQAASWAVRLDAGPLSGDEQRELDAWLACDPRHHGALIRARAHWIDLERMGALAAGREGERAKRLLHRQKRRKIIAAGIAASAVAAAGAGWLALRHTGERYRTEVGEMRRIALSDGSTLMLNTASEVLVAFEAQRRIMTLIKGEALFDVAHEPARPFIVHVSDVHVRAVGTVFAVRLKDGAVAVTVSEGAVELARSEPDVTARVVQRVAANEESVLVPEQRVQLQKLEPAQMQRRLAWLDGRVAFDGEPLGEAVAEVNRHSRRKIVVDDPDLNAQPIVGSFRAADAEGFCRVAAVALGAVAVEEGDTIHLRMGESGP